MCQFADLISDLVKDYINNNQMFTAYDITKDVRKQTKDRVKHDEVKGEVHRMFDNGEMFTYNRSLANLPNVNPQPWIYHPLAADPAFYYNKTPTVQPQIASLNNSINSISAKNNTVYKLDTTNRLCIPAKLVRQAGFIAGDVAHVMEAMNSRELILTNTIVASSMTNSADYLTNYVVDSYNNVRITLAALQKGHLNGKEFEIEGDATKITIRKHS